MKVYVIFRSTYLRDEGCEIDQIEEIHLSRDKADERWEELETENNNLDINYYADEYEVIE